MCVLQYSNIIYPIEWFEDFAIELRSHLQRCSPSPVHSGVWEGGREGGRDGGRDGGREGEGEGGRERGREGEGGVCDDRTREGEMDAHVQCV